MAKVLDDRTEVRTKIDGEYPWSFKAPTKDHAESGCLSAGNYYGVGIRQPIGKKEASNLPHGPIPQEATKLHVDQIFYGSDKRG